MEASLTTGTVIPVGFYWQVWLMATSAEPANGAANVWPAWLSKLAV